MALPYPLPFQASALPTTITDSQPPVFAEEDGREPRAAVQRELSDMDYLKSKMVKSELPSASEEEESEDEAVSCEDRSGAEEEAPSPAPTQQDRGRPGAGPEQGTPSRNETPGTARAEVCV